MDDAPNHYEAVPTSGGGVAGGEGEDPGQEEVQKRERASVATGADDRARFACTGWLSTPSTHIKVMQLSNRASIVMGPWLAEHFANESSKVLSHPVQWAHEIVKCLTSSESIRRHRDTGGGRSCSHARQAVAPPEERQQRAGGRSRGEGGGRPRDCRRDRDCQWDWDWEAVPEEAQVGEHDGGNAGGGGGGEGHAHAALGDEVRKRRSVDDGEEV